jgi:hypothetical protein
MVHCATERKAGLVIVTRDSDYGLTIDHESYVNDALRQEFSDRVSRKRDLRLHSRLSDALKLFDVAVTAQEEESEAELVSRNPFLTNELLPQGRKLLTIFRDVDEITLPNLPRFGFVPPTDDSVENLPKAEPKDVK